MQFGRLHDVAKEFRVASWIDGDGNSDPEPLRLSDLGAGYKVVFCFQHWCPGCHTRGFPTLLELHEALRDQEIGFAAIQTVFEGFDTNTFDKLSVNQKRYGLNIPFGHDLAADDERYPTFMEDYRTAGTPWFTVIDPDNTVVYADFRLDPPRLLAALEAEDVRFGSKRRSRHT